MTSSPINPVFVNFVATGVVHLNGGTAALVCTLFLGPRKNYFNPDVEKPQPGNGINILLGTFILW